MVMRMFSSCHLFIVVLALCASLISSQSSSSSIRGSLEVDKVAVVERDHELVDVVVVPELEHESQSSSSVLSSPALSSPLSEIERELKKSKSSKKKKKSKKSKKKIKKLKSKKSKKTKKTKGPKSTKAPKKIIVFKKGKKSKHVKGGY